MSNTYTVMANAEKHTCWDDPNWDGTLSAEGDCKGCDQAVEYPCRFCGYGHVFTTHSEAHFDNGDTQVAGWDDLTDEWTDSPHIYKETA